jgi:hypothetical protein
MKTFTFIDKEGCRISFSANSEVHALGKLRKYLESDYDKFILVPDDEKTIFKMASDNKIMKETIIELRDRIKEYHVGSVEQHYLTCIESTLKLCNF